MGEEEKEIKDFENLLKDLNSLFNKIPNMIGSSDRDSNKEEKDKEEKSKEFEVKSEAQHKVSNNIEEFIIKPDDVKDEEKPTDDNQNAVDRKEENAQDILNGELEEEKDKAEEAKSKDGINKEDDKIELEVSVDAIIDSKNVNSKENDFKIDFQIEEDQKIKLEFDEKLSDNLEEDKGEEKEFDILQSEDKKEFTLDINNDISIDQQIKDMSDFYNRQSIFSDDLKEIIYLQRPSDVSADRVKKMGIVCAVNSEQLLKSFLKYLDEICFSSKDKKMFVERSFILFYDENFSVENLLVNAGNEKVDAVVFIGNLPVEKVYEIENAVCGSGYMFFSIGMESFSRSRVIDFVLELIARGV